ncbi:exported hypothetical protein [Magnetospirillum sp. UT-4]|nr:exported hypothetical protein [Magnetospirillum sp. UT-4]
MSVSFLPVSFTFSALMTMTFSPMSTWGVKVGRCLPRRRMAMTLARRPRTTPSASITTHFFCTSDGLTLKVFMAPTAKPMTKGHARPALEGAEYAMGAAGVNDKNILFRQWVASAVSWYRARTPRKPPDRGDGGTAAGAGRPQHAPCAALRRRT